MESDESAVLERLARLETKLDVVIVGHDKRIEGLETEVDKLKRVKNVGVGLAAGAAAVGGVSGGTIIARLLGGA